MRWRKELGKEKEKETGGEEREMSKRKRKEERIIKGEGK